MGYEVQRWLILLVSDAPDLSESQIFKGLHRFHGMLFEP